jgi:hypothetical protein
VNVAAIAGRLGGGGHENLAGCTIEGPLHRALDEILAELRRGIVSFSAEASLKSLEIPRESVSLVPVETIAKFRASEKRWKWKQPGTSAPDSPEKPAQAAAQLGHRLRSSRLSCLHRLFSFLRPDSAAGRRRLGLVGADEPRYAQIAHEMLVRFDSAHTLKTAQRLRHSLSLRPSLAGEAGPLLLARHVPLSGLRRPRLERPPALDHLRLHHGGLIYLHMRRFRPGGHLDAALITVACAGIIGFARGASTDMQMAAPLAIGLLGWYAWYETDSKFWLYDIYFFTGLATLAKGPVAPFLAIVIIAAFAFLRREWSILCAAPSGGRAWCSTSPWCCPGSSPCSIRIPPSSASSFLEHNLERFATDRYQHQQPFWYYLVVVLLAMMPWTVIAVRALIDGIQTSVASGACATSSDASPAPTAPATPSLSFWCCGRSFPSSSSPSRNPSCPATFCPPFRPSPSSPETTSSAAAAGAEPLGSGGPRGALRHHDHVRAAAALVCGPRRGSAAPLTRSGRCHLAASARRC